MTKKNRLRNLISKSLLIYLLILFIFILVSGIFAQTIVNLSTPEPFDKNISGEWGKGYEPGEVIVKYKKGVTSKQKKKVKDDVGAKKEEKLLDRINLLKLKKGVTVEDAIKKLKKSGIFEYVEPNYIYHSNFTPNDTYFYKQWGLNNTGQDYKLNTSGTAGSHIYATSAWNTERGFTNEVKVGIIDSGINLTHPDLSARIGTNLGEIANNNIDDDGNGYIDDVNGYSWAGISQGGKYDTDYFLGANANYKYFAQSIIGKGTVISTMAVRLGRNLNPTQPATISIRSNLNGADLAYFTITAAEMPVPGGTYIFTKNFNQSVKLNNGVRYYIAISTENNNITNNYRLGTYDGYNAESYRVEAFSEGNLLRKDGVSWVNYNVRDLWFRTNANSNPTDDDGHGTHVAGITGADSHNNQGVSGVTHGAKLFALKAGDASGTFYSSHIIQAIKYAADNGMKVINMSLGGFNYSIAQQNAVNYAYNRGVVVVVASGNESTSTVSYPAGYNNVIGVGATDCTDTIAPFSNYNASVDVSAPGVDIYSTFWTTPTPNGYDFLQGTSMASPFVAGLAALLLSRNPNNSPARIQEIIEKTADDKGAPNRDDYYGWGRINASSALTTDTVGPTTPTVSSTTHPIENTWYNNDDPSFNWTSSDTSTGYSYILAQSSTTSPDFISESSTTWTSYTNKAEGIWYFMVRAKDELGNWGPVGQRILRIDKTSPTVPQNLVPTVVTANSYGFSWDVSTDAYNVAGYKKG